LLGLFTCMKGLILHSLVIRAYEDCPKPDTDTNLGYLKSFRETRTAKLTLPILT
jgi:hypothetical protein